MIKNLIYDVGMNNGDDTAYYLAKGFRVIAIEANPLLVEQTSRRFEREISAGELVILNIGVSDHEGEFPFYICDTKSEWSTFNLSVAQDKGVDFHQITVPCRRFRSILDEFGTPYYLKLDIEGNEIYCLRDLIVSDLPNYISFEKPNYISFERIVQWTLESLTLLHNLGYKGYKLISQHNYVPVEYPPTWEQILYERAQNLLKSRSFFLKFFLGVIRPIIRKSGANWWLQRQINRARYQPDWIFPPGSSGPFGEDTPGKWQTFEEIIETLAKANSSFDAGEPSVFWSDKSRSFWADFHVKRNA